MRSSNCDAGRADQVRGQARFLLRFALATAMASGMTAVASGQTFAEWFSQQKTHKKYLLEQVVALAAYSNSLRQGYQAAQKGLGSITAYLTQEQGMHQDFFDRLGKVNPAVLRDPEISQIIQRQQDICRILRLPDTEGGLSQAEKEYLAQVRSAVLQDCAGRLQDLERLLGDGSEQADDAARLRGITRISGAVQEIYRFAISFRSQVCALVRRRQQASRETAASRRMNVISSNTPL